MLGENEVMVDKTNSLLNVSDIDKAALNRPLSKQYLELQDLDPQDLELIVECEDFSKLKSKFGLRTKVIKNCYKNTKKNDDGKSKHFSFGQALLNTLNEQFLTFPKYFLGMTTGFITLQFLPLSLMSGALTLVGLAGGGLYLANSYITAKGANKDEEEARQFLYFKNQCADLLIDGLKSKVDGLKNKNFKQGDYNLQPYLKSTTRALNKPVSKLPGIQKFFSSSLMLTTLLFESYYLTAHSMLLINGLSLVAGAMVGSIGLGVSTAAVAGISLFLSYKQYSADKEQEILNRYKNALTSNLTKKIDFYKTEAAKIEKELKPEAEKQKQAEELKVKVELKSENKPTQEKKDKAMSRGFFFSRPTDEKDVQPAIEQPQRTMSYRGLLCN